MRERRTPERPSTCGRRAVGRAARRPSLLAFRLGGKAFPLAPKLSPTGFCSTPIRGASPRDAPTTPRRHSTDARSAPTFRRPPSVAATFPLCSVVLRAGLEDHLDPAPREARRSRLDRHDSRIAPRPRRARRRSRPAPSRPSIGAVLGAGPDPCRDARPSASPPVSVSSLGCRPDLACVRPFLPLPVCSLPSPPTSATSRRGGLTARARHRASLASPPSGSPCGFGRYPTGSTNVARFPRKGAQPG